MTSAATAKILFFIAMALGPKAAPGTILATSNSENYVWMHGSEGWSLMTKELPADAWVGMSEPAVSASENEREFGAILHHDWNGESVLDLADGNEILKQKDAVFYIMDPGAPNQKVYTILYPVAAED